MSFSFRQFFVENGIFVIIPAFIGAIKVLHDILPTPAFLGLAFSALGLYVSYSQVKVNQAKRELENAADEHDQYMKEFNRDQQRRKHKLQVQKEHRDRQKKEKADAKLRKAARDRKEKESTVILEDSPVPAAKSEKKKRVEQDDYSDNEDAALLRYAALQKKK